MNPTIIYDFETLNQMHKDVIYQWNIHKDRLKMSTPTYIFGFAYMIGRLAERKSWKLNKREEPEYENLR